jgi:Ca2+:H+ antiporter
MCFLLGGVKYQQQTFSVMANKAGCSMLLLACIGIIIPTAARSVYGEAVITQRVALDLSHAIALLLIFT